MFGDLQNSILSRKSTLINYANDLLQTRGSAGCITSTGTCTCTGERDLTCARVDRLLLSKVSHHRHNLYQNHLSVVSSPLSGNLNRHKKDKNCQPIEMIELDEIDTKPIFDAIAVDTVAMETDKGATSSGEDRKEGGDGSKKKRKSVPRKTVTRDAGGSSDDKKEEVVMIIMMWLGILCPRELTIVGHHGRPSWLINIHRKMIHRRGKKREAMKILKRRMTMKMRTKAWRRALTNGNNQTNT